MLLRSLFFVLLSSHQIGFSQTLSNLNSIVDISDKSSTQVDSALVQLGFLNTSIDGLKFTYVKKSEEIIMQTMPRQLTYTFTDKASYLKINSEVSSQSYKLVNGEEEITYHNKPKKVSVFEKSNIKISFGTDLNSSTKTTTYFIIIGNSNPKYLNNTVNTETIKQKEAVKEVEKDTVKPKNQPAVFGLTNTRLKKTTNIESINPSSDSTISIVKIRKTIGTSLYKTSYNTYTEVLFNLQFGAEISKAKYMKVKKNYFVDTRIDIDASIFLDMQKYYPATLQTMYLTKSYFSLGLISELRKKNNSFLISAGPALNWTTGKIEEVGRASFITPAFHLGEYVQRHFGTSKQGQDLLFLRLGFDQYFSMKGGYIGSFGLTFGF